jgi:hypothetical protein
MYSSGEEGHHERLMSYLNNSKFDTCDKINMGYENTFINCDNVRIIFKSLVPLRFRYDSIKPSQLKHWLLAKKKSLIWQS